MNILINEISLIPSGFAKALINLGHNVRIWKRTESVFNIFSQEFFDIVIASEDSLRLLERLCQKYKTKIVFDKIEFAFDDSLKIEKDDRFKSDIVYFGSYDPVFKPLCRVDYEFKFKIFSLSENVSDHPYCLGYADETTMVKILSNTHIVIVDSGSEMTFTANGLGCHVLVKPVSEEEIINKLSLLMLAKRAIFPTITYRDRAEDFLKKYAEHI